MNEGLLPWITLRAHGKGATDETGDETTETGVGGVRAIAGEDRMLGTLVRVIHSGKRALDAVMLEMGRMVGESIMLMERAEIADPDL